MTFKLAITKNLYILYALFSFAIYLLLLFKILFILGI